MQETVAIRVDGNNKIGFGHLIRMQALAKQMEKLGARVMFVTRNPEYIKDHPTLYIDDTIRLPEEDIINNILRDHKADMLIVDSYEYDQVRLNQIGELDLTSVYIDDLNRYSFEVDYVVNGNLYAPSLDYQGRAHFLLGTEYLLLREEFSAIARKKIRFSVKDVLLTFGAADPENFTPKILEILINYDRFACLNWHVVVGPVFKNADIIKNIAQNHNNITLHYNPDIKILMNLCDISISAAGSTVYELAVCGVPMILLVVADNQLILAEQAERCGIALNLRWHRDIDSSRIYSALNNMINNVILREKMAVLGQEIVDGRGAERVANTLLDAVRRKMYGYQGKDSG